MSKTLLTLALMLAAMFTVAPTAANAQPSVSAVNTTLHTEDELPEDTVVETTEVDPEDPVLYSEEEGVLDDTTGTGEEIDPRIMESGIAIEDKMATTGAPVEGDKTLIYVAVAALFILAGAGVVVTATLRSKKS
mgnify:CR=1 FL=1